MKNSNEAINKIFNKSFLISLLFFILLNSTTFSQWIQQHPPQGMGIVLSIDFFNYQNGIAGGWYPDPLDNSISGKSFYTADGGAHWLSSVIPSSVRAITNIKFISENTAFAVGAINSSVANDRSSYSWNLFRSEDHYRSAMGITGNITYSAVTLKTTDAGASWFIFGNVPDDFSYLYQLEFMNQDNLIVIGTRQAGVNFSGKLAISTDGGTGWTNVNLPLNSGDLNGLQYIDGKIFAAGFEETSANGTKGIILKSDDNAVSWIKTTYLADNGFNDIKFTDKITGYACSYYFTDSEIPNSRIYRTTNGGDSWNSLNLNLDSVIINKIGVCRNTGVVTILGNKYGDFQNSPDYGRCIILRSTDYGENWTSRGSGINRSVILRDIDFLDSYNAYIAGFLPNSGSSGGVMDPHIYHTTNGGNGNTYNQTTGIPDDFLLFQNYPNPFNPATQIRFTLTRDEFISLKVYNTSGKEIRTLFEGQQIAGSYTIAFDGAGVPSGIYFYTLTAKNYSRTLKMTLLK